MKKTTWLTVLLFLSTGLTMGVYQNCGQFHSFTDQENLSSDRGLRFPLHTVNIKLTDANVYSLSGRIDASGICEGLDEMIGEVTWILKKTTCSTCPSHTITQMDGCVNGTISLRQTLPLSISVLTQEDTYMVNVRLTPRGIPMKRIKGNTSDSLNAPLDDDSSIKPLINSNLPMTDTAEVGSKYPMSVNAEAPGNGILTYQWFSRSRGDADFQEISGANTDSFTLDPVTLDDEKQYKVIIRVQNGGRVVSNILSLTVPRPTPLFETDLPETKTVSYNSLYTMEVEVSATKIPDEDIGEGITYQWFFKAKEEEVSDEFRPIENATTNSYTINPAKIEHEGQYKVIVIITGGKKIQSKILTLTVSVQKPIISEDLKNTYTVAPGSSHTMKVTARLPNGITGVALAYQWSFKPRGSNEFHEIDDAPTNSHTINPAKIEHEGHYKVQISFSLPGEEGLVYISSKTATLIIAPYYWVNTNRSPETHSVACERTGGFVATDQGYGICASGERRPTRGFGYEKISYHHGEYGSSSTGGSIISGSFCYKSEQKTDNDPTDKIAAFLCKSHR